MSSVQGTSDHLALLVHLDPLTESADLADELHPWRARVVDALEELVLRDAVAVLCQSLVREKSARLGSALGSEGIGRERYLPG